MGIELVMHLVQSGKGKFLVEKVFFCGKYSMYSLNKKTGFCG